MDIACIGYYACKNGYKDIGTQKSQAMYKERMAELSAYGNASPDESLIDAIETLSTQPVWAERCNVDDCEFFEDQSEWLNDLATRVAQANR